ncbi:hypothetical protein NJC40_18330 [Pseudomonas sp. 21LCFQ02]|uniref:hypothetical protein n=1 Tax=unclassified Pseudomonas TaxID=196821 RepID=UPI0005EFA0AD|nr:MULTISPECIES: hypothetical protein [unclassified Pseudomonas]MCO8169727.1 hypothetical protein [Pseudomonas sp. 21LCFQ02]MCQ9425306.1 hypothetical protein [Pseudomonas sp. LJDD11]
MRWLFLLLLMLNVFYYLWHQQEAPLRAKEVIPLSLNRSAQQDIRLLSESGVGEGRESRPECQYLGGFAKADDVKAVEQRLKSLDIRTQYHVQQVAGANRYWLAVMPESRRLVGEELVAQLTQDFPQLKNRIILCEGVADLN